MVYKSRRIILHKYTNSILKEPERALFNQTQQQSSVLSRRRSDCLVVGLEFELRVCFRLLRALIIEQKLAQKHVSNPINADATKQPRPSSASTHLSTKNGEAPLATSENDALIKLEDLMSRPPLKRIPDSSKLCANTSTELVLRCSLLLENFDTNTEPRFIVTHLQDPTNAYQI